MILTIANSQTDKYFSSVFDLFRQRGREPILFCADKCLEGETISLSIQNNRYRYYAVIDGKEIDLSRIDAVWYLKPHLPKKLRTFDPPEHREFIRRQFLATWQSLFDVLRDKRWVSPHWNVVRAENKILQLRIASNAGLELPETLISSDPSKIEAFWEYCNREMIVKMVSASPIENHVIFTNRVSESHMASIDTARYAPSIFQRYIPKAYELRIIVVGGKVFVAQIKSQEGETTKTDWRVYNKTKEKIQMVADKLPSNIKQKCLSVVEQLGLRFGCIDMIVTPGGRYVFLEINPNGQWFFIQEATGLPIGEVIVDLLCGTL